MPLYNIAGSEVLVLACVHYILDISLITWSAPRFLFVTCVGALAGVGSVHKMLAVTCRML